MKMDFYGARYHSTGVLNKQTKSVTEYCKNRKPLARNGGRSCPGALYFAAKFVDDKLKIFEDQLNGFRPHASW